MNTTKKQWFYYLAATVSFLLLVLAWQFVSKRLHKKTEAVASMKLAISVAKPHVASVKSYVESVGQCTAFQQISLVPQVEGTLVKVAYPNGGQVKKGDLLFQIDDDSFKAYLKQSEAQLAMDEARHQLNVLQLKRSEGLRSGNFVSQQEYDTYKANVDASAAQIEFDKAACVLRGIDLGHCYIQAPFAGELGKSAVDPNAFITKGTQLAVLNQLQPIYVDSFLAEKHLVELQKALKEHPDAVTVEARLIDDATVLQTGQLVFVSNEVEKGTGTFDVRAQFENEQLQVWAGRGVDLKIYFKTLQNVLLVPESAIHEGNKGSFVYIVNAQGLSEMRYVEIDQTYDGWIVVLSGLSGDEQVIAEGHALLAPGIPVQATTTLTAPASLK